MKIAIYGSRHQDEYIADIMSLLRYMVDAGHKMVMHPKLHQYLSANVAHEADAQLLASIECTDAHPSDADLAMSVGGDGTFLRTAQWVADAEMPVIGVNTGHLGFLAPFSIDDARRALEQGLASYSIIERSLLQVDMPYATNGPLPCALNEVAILKRDTASMLTVSAHIDGQPLADYLCDGLIVSTPTGSTGYNLSVGGPIVQPGAPDVVISPIAAHSLTMRPLVVSDSSVLELRVSSRAQSCLISIDGRSYNLHCGSTIYVSRAQYVLRTVCKPGHNFFTTLRDKLLWGAKPEGKG